MLTQMQPNVLCSTSHNTYILLAPNETRTFMATMRVQRPGTHWRFSMTNTVDTNWADGARSRANMPGGTFDIVSAAFSNGADIVPVTFEGKLSRIVHPDEQVTSDICNIESARSRFITFRWCLRAGDAGAIVPATPNSQALCAFAPGDATYAGPEAFTDARTLEGEDENMCALPDLFEAEGAALSTMAFIGDSITQGVGTRIGYYESWAARIAAALADRYATLNLGLGYAQIADAACDGAWLNRAKHCDVVNVCLGVNDLLHGDGSACILRLRAAIAALKSTPNAPRIVLFTTPPFDYEGCNIERWHELNAAITAPDHMGADYVFDMASVLSVDNEHAHMAKYGPHPDGVGGAAVAEAYVKRFMPEVGL